MDPALLILQKLRSPFRPLVTQLVKLVNPETRMEEELTEAPARYFVLWDLWGFSTAQIQATGRILAAAGSGIALMCPRPDLACLEVALSCEVNQISIAPKNAEEIYAAVVMGVSNHLRIQTGLIETSQLQKEHADRDLVEQAKSVLMKKLHLSEAEAMRQLQIHSRRSNTRLPEVARFVLQVQGMLPGEPD